MKSKAKFFRRALSVILTLVMLVSVMAVAPVTAGAVVDDSSFASSIASLKTRYVDGQYWTACNSCKYEGTGPTECGPYYYNESKCGIFYYNGVWKAAQCMGFACKMWYKIFGTNPYDVGSKHTDASNLKPGDIVYGNLSNFLSGASCHAIFITGVSGNTVTFADCNRTGYCRVSWNNTTTKGAIQTAINNSTKSGLFGYITHAPNNGTNGGGNDPYGTIDSVSDTGNGSIKTSDHNGESGTYIIDPYAYDACGNQASTRTSTIITNDPTEVASTTYDGNTYKVFNSGYTWQQAKEWCEENGGHLATITSSAEWSAIKKALEKFNGEECWLGAEDTSGSWKWVTGESFGYDNWASNQPDNAGGTITVTAGEEPVTKDTSVEPFGPDKEVTGITLSNSEYTLGVGESSTLSVAVEYKNYENYAYIAEKQTDYNALN